MNLEEIFPYPSFRSGQRELSQAVYEACKSRDKLVVEAMSGFGKTAAVLSGCILAAQEDGMRVVYLCRTKRQVLRVVEEARLIQKRHPFIGTTLFSKGDYCLLKEGSTWRVNQESFKWYCSFHVTNNLCSYFMNVSLVNREMQALIDRLGGTMVPHSAFLAECERLHVCPYEVSRLAATQAILSIATYHYLIDEASRSVLLGSSRDLPPAMGVVDEAHNLRDFIRDSSMRVLSVRELQLASQDCRNLFLEHLASSLHEIAQCVRELLSNRMSWRATPASLMDALERGHDESWLPSLVTELSGPANKAWGFVSIERNFPPSLLRIGGFLQSLLSARGSRDWTVVKSEDALYLTNINPGELLSGASRNLWSLVLISATVNPSRLFLHSLGLDGTKIHTIDTNYAFTVKTIIDTGVSTRFAERKPSMYDKIAKKMASIYEATERGVGIFVPSYAVLERLTDELTSKISKELLVERRQMTSREGDEMMSKFKSETRPVLLAVQGGRFSEGEDFPGDQMGVSIVVGLSLPPPSPITYAEYTSVAEMGRHEAYLVVSLLPALRKAFQAAGRHIRNPGKRGMVFFLDARFNNREVIGLMPSWMKEDLTASDLTPEEIRKVVEQFFSPQPS